MFFIHFSYMQNTQTNYAFSEFLYLSVHKALLCPLSSLHVVFRECNCVQEPSLLTNVPPCQRQRGFKTGGFGRLYHLQAIFQPIHLARIIECPCLSTPRGVTSYHKPPAQLLIKQGMGGTS